MQHSFKWYKAVALAEDFLCRKCGIIKRIYVAELNKPIQYYKSGLTSSGYEGYWEVPYTKCSEFLMQQIME